MNNAIAPESTVAPLQTLISDRDVRQHTANLDDTLVESVMTADPVTVSPETSVEEAASLMLLRDIGCRPVTEHNGLVGIITTTDLLRALLDVALLHAKQTYNTAPPHPSCPRILSTADRGCFR